MIQARALSTRYASGAVALDHVDLDVRAGEFVALIGPSGAGKSTLLRCLNGLVTPTEGEVMVDGELVVSASEEALRRVRARVGFVFQHFNLVKRLSVLDNVRVGTLSRVKTWGSLVAHFPEIETERARRALRRVGLADEPMSSLDPALSRSLMELLRHINGEDGLTVIASLHVLDLAVSYGERVVGLRAGRIVHDGPPETLSPSVAQMIFGSASR